ncbi:MULTISPECIES: YdcF family protein [Roseomonadaceae]|uniref:YdcF family protein n=1 Tax=Falsiroseomonas oleicola TaxID=2801474 RepID=A0ABS6H6Z5_9PROT|nr:YdcF family protein [Roseomonas oleicola]MBU8543115.1 YdcF family protein [Roseomonas oleicola]
MPPELEAAARALFAFLAVPDPPGPADLIVCLGSYDTRVAVHAAGLARRHPAARVICTGRDGNWTRGRWPATEAEVFAGIMLDHGVAPGRITLEPRATHIGENIAFARALSAWWQVAQAVFVTKPQTILRVRHTLPVQWPGLAARVDAPPLGFDAYVTDADFRHRLVNEMVGDIDRLIAYPALGFQTPCEVPAPIRAARDLLKANGFTEHALP